MKLTSNKIFSFMLAAAFALTLAGCGGGGGGAADTDDPTTMPEPMATLQEMCEDAGGRWNADETCTDADALAAEAEEARIAAAAATTKAAGTKMTAIGVEGRSGGG